MNSNYQKPINLGHDKEYKILDLAEKIKYKVNSKVIYKNLKLPEADPQRRNPSTLLAKQILNWEPKFGLSEGLDKTIKFFANNLN